MNRIVITYTDKYAVVDAVLESKVDFTRLIRALEAGSTVFDSYPPAPPNPEPGEDMGSAVPPLTTHEKQA